MSKAASWLFLATLFVVVFLGYMTTEVIRPAWRPAGATPPAGLSDVLFYLLAALTIAGALGVALSRNILYSSIGLLMALLGAGSLYVFLSADFLAAVQVLLYAGGILVLMVFGVMLTHRIADVTVETTYTNWKAGAMIAGSLWVLLVTWINRVPWIVPEMLPDYAPTTRQIGINFLGDYLVPFEYSSIVLLIVVLGAATLVRKEVE